MQITATFRSLRTGEGLKGQLLRGGVGSVAVKIASILVSILAVIVVARLLGPQQFGIYSFVLAIITLATIPAQFGLPNLVVRETAKAQADTDWARMRGIWRWSNIVALVSSSLLIAVIGAVVVVFGLGAVGGGSAPLLFALPLIPLLALGNLRGAALRGLRRVVLGLLPEQVLRHGFLVLFVGVGWLILGTPISAEYAIIMNVLGAAVTFAFGAIILFRVRPDDLKSVTPTYESRAWLLSALPLALIAGMNQITKQTDIVMLGFFAAPEEVGIYRVAVQGAMIVAFAQNAATMVVAPYFARFHAQGDRARLQRLATQNARAVTAISLIPFLGFVFFGEEIVALLFGADYTDAALPLTILAAGQLINALVSSVGPLLSMTGHERAAARMLVGMVALTIILNLLLIPPFGLMGAAVATAVTIVVKNLFYLRMAISKLGIRTLPF